MTMSSERGGIVTGWLLKLVVSIALVGVCAFEAGAIVVAKVGIEGVARDAAGDAAETYARNGNVQEAEQAARDHVERNGAVLESFSVVEGGEAVIVTASKRAKTLLVHRIGAIDDWATARSTRRRGVT
jgi:hypothetical protein